MRGAVPSYVFMARCLIKHKNTLNLTCSQVPFAEPYPQTKNPVHSPKHYFQTLF